MGLYVIFQKFGHFHLKDIFVSLSQKLCAKKVIFCDFLKKSLFLVIFDTKIESVAHFLSKNVYFNICHSKNVKVTVSEIQGG